MREGHRVLVPFGRGDRGDDLIAWHHETCETNKVGQRSLGRTHWFAINIENSVNESKRGLAVEEIQRVAYERRDLPWRGETNG